MKKSNLAIFALTAMLFAACHTVPAGHEGAIVRYGSGVDTLKVLSEGTTFGVNFILDDVVNYEVREQTITMTEAFNDKNEMVTTVEAIVYFKPKKGQVNRLHKHFGTEYANSKLLPVLRSSLGKIVPQFTAVELNKTHRERAQSR